MTFDEWERQPLPKKWRSCVDDWGAEREKLTERMRELEDILKFYADRKTYRDEETDRLNAKDGFFPYGLDDTPISQDVGNKARAVLDDAQHKEGEEPNRIFSWTCYRCGAIHPSTVEHCSCEAEVQHKEEKMSFEEWERAYQTDEDLIEMNAHMVFADWKAERDMDHKRLKRLIEVLGAFPKRASYLAEHCIGWRYDQALSIFSDELKEARAVLDDAQHKEGE